MNGPVDFGRLCPGPLGRAHALAVLLTGDRHAAEDLVQETLLRAAQHNTCIDPATADAYVRRILYTRSIDAWRWRRRHTGPAMVSERHTDMT